jgi:hypothetical protein
MEAALFEEFNINLFQLVVGALMCGAIGWLIAVAVHYDKVDHVVAQLHATEHPHRGQVPPKAPPETPPGLAVVLDVLQALFADHRVLMWRHAVALGTPRDSSMSMHSTVSLARAYTVLREHGRTPSTAAWPHDLRARDDKPAAGEPLQSAKQ